MRGKQAGELGASVRDGAQDRTAGMSFDLDRWSSQSAALDVSDVDFEVFRREPLPSDALRCIRYMHDVEHHTVCYLRDLLVTRLHQDPETTTFLTLWSYEEHWHGEALGAVLAAHGEEANGARVARFRRHLAFRDYLHPLLAGLSTAVMPEFAAVYLTWGAVNEWTTQAGYVQLASRARHAVLSKLLGRITRQEGRHIDYYAHAARERLERSASTRRITRFALRHLWAPVGAGIMPNSELSFLATYLFGDEAGYEAAARIDRQIDRLPGLEGLGLLTGAVDRLRVAPLAA